MFSFSFNGKNNITYIVLQFAFRTRHVLEDETYFSHSESHKLTLGASQNKNVDLEMNILGVL